MTKEAKVGLLLGLVFIIGIAVVLRGVSDGLDSEQEEQMLLGHAGSPDTTNSAVARENLSMAAEQAEQLTPNSALRPVETVPTPPAQPIADPRIAMAQPTLPEQVNDVSYVSNLPDMSQMPDASSPVSPQPVSPQPIADIPAPAGEPMFRPVNPSPLITAGGGMARGNTLPANALISGSSSDIVAPAPRPSPQPTARTYTVESGDKLSSIAIKMYGPVEGKRWVNILRIGDASGLTNLDAIREGQKLTIPALPGMKPQSTNPAGVETRLERIAPTQAQPASSGRTYLVKENDTLWDIAKKELGSGARYREILKLNADIIKNENDIKQGLKLRLP